MVRRVFFSFDWDDVWRVNQVRNNWVPKGSQSAAGFIDAADFEEVKRQGDTAIEKWIDGQLEGTSVTVVLIGEKTYHSKWVQYEINQSVNKEKGLIGIYIHTMRDQRGERSKKGQSPLNSSYSHYNWIEDDGKEHLSTWIDQAADQVGR